MPKRQPIKLNREPLIEAVCQVTVTGTVPVHAYFPGILMAKFPGEVSQLEQLPQAMVPEEIRAAHPALEFQPLVQFSFRGILVLVGTRQVTVSNQKPYLGWAAFKPLIVEVLTALLDPQLVTSVQRVSLKYTNVLNSEEKPDPLGAMDWKISVGSLPLMLQATQLRTETYDDGIATIVSMIGSVTAQSGTGAPIQGTLIDVDTVCNYQSSSTAEFLNTMPTELDRIRRVNKATFFECLTDEAINELEPVYE